MDPWYKVVMPRKEVREGRSFSPDEFAIALEQVITGTAPEDYRDAEKFFSRTYFTRALSDHTGMVLRRLAGETTNTAPVLTLITQFGGGKTHTLTALYHLAMNSADAARFPGVAELLRHVGLDNVPEARVSVFVGNAWDPSEGRETPWIDLARQIGGDAGVATLGSAATSAPPGTETLGRLFEVAGKPVLLLFDEVLNFLNRHRSMAEGFFAFIQNLTVAATGTTRNVAVISLPRSQVEMTDWDQAWQGKITKVVRRVAKDLIANDEAEISEVVRRRLFEHLGAERLRRRVAKAYADWCFERRAQLPPEWTAVDTSATEAKAREFLRDRFEACYPFHPAALSVFQRKWQAVPQYQQTRGTLAMLAQWISWAHQREHAEARREPLITLGSAPLENGDFRAVVLGQVGESRLEGAILTDIAAENAHARALDADTRGPLRDIHRRVGTAILFECSGGQVDKVAHLPELRFALGGPQLDTTSIDNAALALEGRAFFIRRVGTDGFRLGPRAKLNKVMNDRRASLDDETEVRPAIRKLIEGEFRRGAAAPVSPITDDGASVPDTPRLTLIVVDPEIEWDGSDAVGELIADWTRQRGASPRRYPAALVWCLKKPGRDLRDKVEVGLAWQRVAKELDEGTLGSDVEPAVRSDMRVRVEDAESEAKDEVWASYRFVVLLDAREKSALKAIDLGAGHSSAGETLSGRVITALKGEGLVNEAVGAGYIERHWPEAFKESGAWPLKSLRQSFLDGSLDRLLDPDRVLTGKICEFVERGEFGLGSGERSEGGYDRVWFAEAVAPEEVAFETGVVLLTRARAEVLKSGEPPPVKRPDEPEDIGRPPTTPDEGQPTPGPETPAEQRTLRLVGSVPPELWNRFGTKVLPKLRWGADLRVTVDCSVSLDAKISRSTASELRQVLVDLGLSESVQIDED